MLNTHIIVYTDFQQFTTLARYLILIRQIKTKTHEKNNKTKQSLLLLVSLCSLNITAQEVWNIDQCMAYAVEHNHIVKQRHLEADNYRMDRMKAIGQFLPGVSGNVSAQYNFGRSVDPETNTYISKSTFNNGYSMEASIPIFREEA